MGDIDYEHDDEAEERLIQTLGTGRFLVQALTPIDEFNDAFHTELSDEEFDTVGGLVLSEFGRLPTRGEIVEIGGLKVTVHAADKRRIHQLMVQA